MNIRKKYKTEIEQQLSKLQHVKGVSEWVAAASDSDLLEWLCEHKITDSDTLTGWYSLLLENDWDKPISIMEWVIETDVEAINQWCIQYELKTDKLQKTSVLPIEFAPTFKLIVDGVEQATDLAGTTHNLEIPDESTRE